MAQRHHSESLCGTGGTVEGATVAPSAEAPHITTYRHISLHTSTLITLYGSLWIFMVYMTIE